MQFSINTNPSATQASLNLSRASDMHRKSLARLSSGQRIVNPADDAGGLAVGNKLDSKLARLQKIEQNLKNSISFTQLQEGALRNVGAILTRMSDLKTLSMDVTKTSSDVENYNKEFLELQKQVGSITRHKFNGISLFTTIDKKDHALQSLTSDDSTVGNVVSLARNFVKGEYVAKSGAILGGKELPATSTSVEPISTKAGATGIDANGNKIAIGSTDSNWSVNGLLTSSTRIIPIAGAWVAEPATAAWIGSGNWANPPGNSTFTMDFDLTGYDVSIVKISGMAATDDGGRLEINGVDMGLGFGFSALRSFTLEGNASGITVDGIKNIAGGFLPGINQFTMKINNAFGPHGLLFDQLSISATKTTTTATTSFEFEDLEKFSMEDFSGFIQNIASAIAQIGAEQSRLNMEMRHNETARVNLEAAKSRIMDADMAQESSRFAKTNVLVQSSASMVAQANQISEVALRLIVNR
jgi:flagellin